MDHLVNAVRNGRERHIFKSPEQLRRERAERNKVLNLAKLEGKRERRSYRGPAHEAEHCNCSHGLDRHSGTTNLNGAVIDNVCLVADCPCSKYARARNCICGQE